jgi:hypothetical protein
MMRMLMLGAVGVAASLSAQGKPPDSPRFATVAACDTIAPALQTRGAVISKWGGSRMAANAVPGAQPACWVEATGDVRGAQHVETFARADDPFSATLIMHSARVGPAWAQSLPKTMKSPEAARGWSLGSTLIPMASGAIAGRAGSNGGAGVLIVGGSLLGPSAGHFYAGQPARALAGVALRTALLGVFVAATCWDECSKQQNDAQEKLAVVFSAAILGSAVYDIVTAPRSARRYNEKHGLTVSVLPRHIDGSPGLTLRTSLRF